MLPIPVPTEPWRFAGGRVWLDDIVAKGQDDTLQYLEGCASSPIDDSRKVNDKTEAYRKFCKTVLSKAGPGVTADPEAIAVDLCHNRASAEDKFRAFLRHYVKTSVQLRPSLGPEEYEWVRDVDSAITVTEFWKALVREFDCGFLQTKRRQEPEKASLYSLKFCDTSQGAGSVWKWIREDLAEELGLSRGQMFRKQEVTGEDVLAILSVLWARPDVVTCQPTERLTSHAMILLASMGAFRLGALSRIQYHQVELAIVADPVNKSTRLVGTVTIVHNKVDKNALKRSQDDRISFSVAFAPCPIVCVLSLIVAKAIKDDAFDVGFESLDALLSRPTLGGLAYLPIRWKNDILETPIFELPYHRLWEIWRSCTWALGCRDPPRPYAMRVGGAGRLDGVLTPAVRNFVVDNSSEVFEKSYLPNHFRGQLATFAFGALAGDYEPLFRQLCNAFLKVDANAPMTVTPEEKATFEQRHDLRTISARLADDGEGEPPGWRDELHSRASYIRKSLAKQLKVQKRTLYFENMDRQRALGTRCAPFPTKRQTPAIQDESYPFEGASAIGSFFQHFSATQDLRPATLKSYSELLVAYLRRLPAEVVHSAYAAIREATASDPDPSSSTPSLAEPPLRSRALQLIATHELSNPGGRLGVDSSLLLLQPEV
ncbi:hypothetical protein D7B24_001004 [Verticillium nonalfalfae]|uniref:Uncharacterized protein n=1 Tax=Verticillium nonalfalfae TaxID=1051616 RepID=A0A3M9Y0I8_9PEZI|nr:uncharacterized protein D7B24_001004 [Verticillium nonalfalfae]RNJ54029.1 hypothetical protein D7B24_001004 [Verticillium nonalfalfae]